MEEVKEVYNLTTDYNTAYDFTNKNEMFWDDVINKIFCIQKEQEKPIEDFINEVDCNPVKVIKDDTEEYYLINKETTASYSYKHQILSLMLVTEEIYKQELSKLNDKPKINVKR